MFDRSKSAQVLASRAVYKLKVIKFPPFTVVSLL